MRGRNISLGSFLFFAQYWILFKILTAWHKILFIQILVQMYSGISFFNNLFLITVVIFDISYWTLGSVLLIIGSCFAYKKQTIEAPL